MHHTCASGVAAHATKYLCVCAYVACTPSHNHTFDAFTRTCVPEIRDTNARVLKSEGEREGGQRGEREGRWLGSCVCSCAHVLKASHAAALPSFLSLPPLSPPLPLSLCPGTRTRGPVPRGCVPAPRGSVYASSRRRSCTHPRGAGDGLHLSNFPKT